MDKGCSDTCKQASFAKRGAISLASALKTNVNAFQTASSEASWDVVVQKMVQGVACALISALTVASAYDDANSADSAYSFFARDSDSAFFLLGNCWHPGGFRLS